MSPAGRQKWKRAAGLKSRRGGGNGVKSRSRNGQKKNTAVPAGGNGLKQELCVRWLKGLCPRSEEKCWYFHGAFPCLYYHTGRKCKYGDRCQFRHGDRLSDYLKDVLVRHVNQSPPAVLGSFPRYAPDVLLSMIAAHEQTLAVSPGHEPENDWSNDWVIGWGVVNNPWPDPDNHFQEPDHHDFSWDNFTVTTTNDDHWRPYEFNDASNQIQNRDENSNENAEIFRTNNLRTRNGTKNLSQQQKYPMSRSRHVSAAEKDQLCRNWIKGTCKRDEASCWYYHESFPCKYYHMGKNCKFKNKCKFLHGGKLTEHLKSVLQNHLLNDPPDVVGPFPSYSEDKIFEIIAKNEGKLSATQVTPLDPVEKRNSSPGESYHDTHGNYSRGEWVGEFFTCKDTSKDSKFESQPVQTPPECPSTCSNEVIEKAADSRTIQDGGNLWGIQSGIQTAVAEKGGNYTSTIPSSDTGPFASLSNVEKSEEPLPNSSMERSQTINQEEKNEEEKPIEKEDFFTLFCRRRKSDGSFYSGPEKKSRVECADLSSDASDQTVNVSESSAKLHLLPSASATQDNIFHDIDWRPHLPILNLKEIYKMTPPPLYPEPKGDDAPIINAGLDTYTGGPWQLSAIRNMKGVDYEFICLQQQFAENSNVVVDPRFTKYLFRF